MWPSRMLSVHLVAFAAQCAALLAERCWTQSHLAVLYCVCLTASSSWLSCQHFSLPPGASVASVVIRPHDLRGAYQWLSQEEAFRAACAASCAASCAAHLYHLSSMKPLHDAMIGSVQSQLPNSQCFAAWLLAAPVLPMLRLTP